MKNIELVKEVTHKNVVKLKHDAKYKRHVRDLEEGTLKQVHFKGSLPKFKITGDGAYYPNKMQ